MTSFKDRDVESWLRSKLELPWSSSHVSASLTTDILQALRLRFTLLPTNLKIGLLFSILTVRKRDLASLTGEIKELLKIASVDDDEWVRVSSAILAPYPANGTLNFELENTSDSFASAIEVLKTKSL